MKKFKKVMALSLALAMGLSLCACGGDDATTTEGTTTGGADAPPATEAIQEVEMPDEEGETIYIYSWNDELGQRMEFFNDKYPQYADRIEYINLGMGGTDDEYKTAIATLLEAGISGSDKYPSIIAADNDVALNYTQSDYSLPMADIGIGGADFDNMYQYTLDYATYNGAVKAVTWQATPGVICYRTDIAEEVLGAGDPETVSAAISDWDKFFETADKMKEKGYKMVSGPDDIKYALIDQKTSPWVTDDKLNIDQWVTDYLEYSKKLYDGGYTNKTGMWDDAWKAGMDADVFCYFGCTWFLYWSLLEEKEGVTYEHAADYNICEGPVSYHWGGTYLTVTKECPDTALAALVLRTLCCDTEVMTEMCAETKDFVNNKVAVKAVSDSDRGKSEKCGGADPIPTFMASAENIDLSKATSYDSTFNGFVDTASASYNSGDAKDVDAAIQMIKDAVSDGYSFITVE